MRAALYIRVSTGPQRDDGYSIPQQRDALYEYCQKNGYEVVGEFQDVYSGAFLDRPGLDRLRDLVANGGVDIVLTSHRDRFSREPTYRYILKGEFRGHGCQIKALQGDIGDGTPEGELSEGVVDLIAKYERSRIAERTAGGRVTKARQGKIPGSGTPPLGFRYEDGYYHVVEEKMSLVRDIFQRVADGQSLNEVVRYLERIGAPTPGRGKWHRFTIRTMISNEAYVGTYYYGKTRKRQIPTVEVVNGERVYGSRTEKENCPKEEWIGVPVPDSGIPPEIIQRARQNIEGNVFTPSNNHGLTWELSGGVGLCGVCGSRLRTRSPNNATKKYFYYTCLNDSCPSNKHYRKEELEKRVGRELADTLQPDTWSEFVDRTISRKLRDLQKMHDHPSESRKTLLKRKSTTEGKLDRVLDLHIDGTIPKETYLEKKTAIEDQIETVKQELSKLDDLDGEIKRIEFMRSLLLGIGPPQDGMPEVDEDGYVDTYSIFTNWGGEPTLALPDGGKKRASERRQEFYRKMDLCVRVRPDDLEVQIANLAISQFASPS